jgi:hypothetical protein
LLLLIDDFVVIGFCFIYPLLDENRHLKELVGQQALSIEAQKSWPESPESWDGNGASTSRETDGRREAVESSFGSSRNG